jgi:hypothetical protein
VPRRHDFADLLSTVRALRRPPQLAGVRLNDHVHLRIMHTESEAIEPKVALRADVDWHLAELVRAAALQDSRTVAGWVRVTLAKALDQNGHADA